jgi:sugar O-acyltransferase (sialic acid O-acetyltransferase NeuD family)
MEKIILAGYSGHAFVVADILTRSGFVIQGYFEKNAKQVNPFNLVWLGDDGMEEVLIKFKNHNVFIAIGNNSVRRSLFNRLTKTGLKHINAIDRTSIISSSVLLKGSGVMIGANAVVNALSAIGNGVILNTSCIVEHECKVGNFAHIGPSAILCGNVSVGENTFIGAGAVIKEGVMIGNDVTIGAGAVIIRDIVDNLKVAGNPGRIL